MKKTIFNLALSVFVLTLISSCDGKKVQQMSDSGTQKASVKIPTDSEGHTSEQRNIIERLKRDNKVGEAKHLYIISSYSGDVMEYSTVKGKVTSGGKRLSPKTVNGYDANMNSTTNYVTLGNNQYVTDEVLDDGGAYGESGSYLFWFDAQDNYHQYYPSGGTYLHISEKPLRIRKANLTLSID